MKSLEKYMITYRLVDTLNDIPANGFTILVKDSQPIQLFNKDGVGQEFLTVQLNNAFLLEPNDLDVVRSVLIELFAPDVTTNIPAFVLVNYDNQIQGVIRPQEVKDLYANLELSSILKTDEFSGSIVQTWGFVDLPAIAWICPIHSDVPPFYAHQMGSNIPPCPVGNHPRIPKVQQNPIDDSSPANNAKSETISRLLSRLIAPFRNKKRM